MIRKTLTILSLIGLITCSWLWATSYWDNRLLFLVGRYHMGYVNHYFSLNATATEVVLLDGRVGLIVNGPGKVDSFGMPIGNIVWSGALHLSIPTVLFSILPAIGLTRLMRRRYRRTHGLCKRCGYDLRGSKDKCPECGTNRAEQEASLEQGDL